MSFPLNDKTSTIDTRTLSVSNTMTQPRVPDVTLWPAAPAGSTVYDEATSAPYYYDGAAWQPFGGGGGGGGENLAATLVLGNNSGPSSIVMAAGQGISGADELPLSAQNGISVTTTNGSAELRSITSSARVVGELVAELRSDDAHAIVNGLAGVNVGSSEGDVILIAGGGGKRVTANGAGGVALTTAAGQLEMRCGYNETFVFGVLTVSDSPVAVTALDAFVFGRIFATMDESERVVFNVDCSECKNESLVLVSVFVGSAGQAAPGGAAWTISPGNGSFALTMLNTLTPIAGIIDLEITYWVFNLA